MPQNGTIAGEGLLFQVSYTGGTGNDVTLKRVSAPPSTMAQVFSRETNNFTYVQAQGIPGLRYEVQRTLSLNPVIQWFNIGAATAGVNGIVEFRDIDFGDRPMRFYRAISP